jgi:hypothetical protein
MNIFYSFFKNMRVYYFIDSNLLIDFDFTWQ